MWPNPADSKGYHYPAYGLFQIHGSVPEKFMRLPQELDDTGDPRMPVIKHGRTSGTTMGWLNGLSTLR